MRRMLAVSIVIIILTGLACASASNDDGVVCGRQGGKKHVSCEALTQQVVRNGVWRDYCLEQPDCAKAVETGLYATLGPEALANYPDYGEQSLVCAEVNYTGKDGTEKIRRFILDNSDDGQSFEIVDEVEVESCVNMSS